MRQMDCVRIFLKKYVTVAMTMNNNQCNINSKCILKNYDSKKIEVVFG